MKLIAEQPLIITRKTGCFWFPKLHQYKNDLICMVATTADVAQGYWPAVTYFSGDQGKSWDYLQQLNYSHSAIVNAEQSLLFLPYEFWPKSSDSSTEARALGQSISFAANKFDSQHFDVEFLGFPKPLAKYNQDQLCLLTSSKILRLGEHLIIAAYGRYQDEKSFSLFSLSSIDGGLSWVFRSCIAASCKFPLSSEGASEPDIVELKDGRILCVFRIGSGEKYSYHKCYSSDKGLSWSESELMPGIFSVEPQLLRLENGVLVLAGGRPGLFLWVSVDGFGIDWQVWNLAEHHNKTVADKSLQFDLLPDIIVEQTTSYLSLIALEKDQLMVCYDRLANGWDAAPGPWGDDNVIFSLRVRLKTELK